MLAAHLRRRRRLAAALGCVLVGGAFALVLVPALCVGDDEKSVDSWVPRSRVTGTADKADPAPLSRPAPISAGGAREPAERQQARQQPGNPQWANVPGVPGWRGRFDAVRSLLRRLAAKPAAVEPGPLPMPSDGWRPRKPADDAPAAVPASASGPALKPPPERRRPDTLPVLLPDPTEPAPEPVVLPPPKRVTPATDPAPVDPPGERIPTPPTPVLPRPRALENDTEREIVLAAARNAVRQRNWDQAVNRFEEFFRRFGEDADVREEYAGVLLQADRVRLALKQFAQAVGLRPDAPRLRVAYGNAAVLAREYPLAILQFQTALELEPKNFVTAVQLARAYLFDGDPARAQALYDRVLGRLRPEDEDAPTTLAALLVDLDRPAEALAFLKEFLERTPHDVDLLAVRVRALERLGDRPRAREALQALQAQAPRELTVRRELAEALYGADAYELAAAVYEQMLQIEPGNVAALVGAGRTQFQLFQPQAGRRFLECVRPTPENERLLRQAWAEYHRSVGEYIEAKQIYQDLLRLDVNDHETRLYLADLYERQREDDKAKAEYAKVPPGSGLGRRARLGAASVLTLQYRFAEAAEVCKKLLGENPDDAAATAQLVRSLAKGGKSPEAVELARAYLRSHPRNEPGQTSVRLALGRALLEGRKPQEAVTVYEQLLTRVGGRVPETFYGLARAKEMAGDKDAARQALTASTPGFGEDTRTRLLISDLFGSDAEDLVAVEIVAAVVKLDDDNLAALTRLAEVQGRLGRQSGDIHAAVQTAQAVLERSPTNVRGRLALARALPVARDYAGAVAEYDRLHTADPELFVPQREKARVLYSANDFGGGAAAFLRLQTPDPDEQLRIALIGLAEQDPRIHVLIGTCLAAPAPARLLKAEVSKVVGALHDPELSAALERVLLDHEARATEATLARLEGRIKDNSWKPYAVIPVARTLLDIEPANTAVTFDLNQAHGSLKQTHLALDAANRDLAIDPREREAAIAQQRAGLELNPSLQLGLDFFQQRGRDGLAQIERTYYRAFTRLPFGDENEFIGLGYARANFRPTDDRALQGNILTVRAQAKYPETLLFHAQVNLETYEDRIQDRPTFDIGARYDCTEQLTLRASGFLENVLENGEALRQDTYRGGVRLGADYRYSRRWLFSGTYTYSRYSDNNDANELFVLAEHTLCFPPTQLKLVLTGDFFGYREPTVFPTADPRNLFGAIHPYFAPDFFAFYEGRIEYTQWLSRDYFVYSNQCWYSLQYALGFDDRLATYNSVRGQFNFDVKPWLTIGAEVRATFSDVYRATAALGYVVIRFPHPLW